jgi:pyocin large subunit-like protein
MLKFAGGLYIAQSNCSGNAVNRNEKGGSQIQKRLDNQPLSKNAAI